MLSLLPAVATLLAWAPQTKWEPPFQMVTTPAGYERHLNRLGADGTGIFVDRDQITFLGRGKENPLVGPDWLRAPFTRDEAQDVWVAQARMKDWNHAFFTYGVKVGGKRQNRAFWASRAPKAPQVAETLQGTLRTVTIPSKELGESRDVMVYLPPKAGPGMNVVYMSDGQACREFAQVLEPLILQNRVAPTAIVGIFHGEYTGDITAYDLMKDFRAREYLKVADPDRFEQHLKFVTNEVMPWAEKEFGVSADPRYRALMGYSNGGAFALTASVEKPELFANILPFSIAAIDAEALTKEAVGKRLPTYWMAAGTLEVFSRNTETSRSIVRPGARGVHFDLYVTGHDQEQWKLAFAKAMPTIFPWRSR